MNKAAIANNNNKYIGMNHHHYQLHPQQQQQQQQYDGLLKSSVSVSTTSSASISTNNTSTAINQQADNEKNTKFYQTFKTLFEIFDPELKGYIDLNELELLGANQNEILNNIINYLKQNQHLTNYVTFDKFVNAADVILKRRKQAKSVTNSSSKPSSSISSSSSSASKQVNKTLSEEFNQPHSSQNNHQFIPYSHHEPFVLLNANSYDVNVLLEQENQLLNDGLAELNKIKQHYEHKLNENKLKKFNILKLKHQNLFSIDKMLTNLNELNNFNKILANFNHNNNNNNNNNTSNVDVDRMTLNDENIMNNNRHSLNTIFDSNSNFSSNAFVNNNNNNNGGLFNDTSVDMYDKYIKEKQERIDYLQKEKSTLIRKLFEIRSKLNQDSMAANKNDTIQQQALQQLPINIKIDDKLYFKRNEQPFRLTGGMKQQQQQQQEDYLFQ